MKTILVPVDFSEVSENALNYAAGLAKFVKAKLILLHVYHVPLPASEAPIMVLSMDDLEEENRGLLKRLSEKVKDTHGTIETELIVKAGFVVDELLSIISEKEIDLVVMGVTGAGTNPNILFGSSTTSLIKKTKTPVLVIPKNVYFKQPEKIVFACDHKKIVSENIIDKLKEYGKLFDAGILVLDIVNPEEVTTLDQAVAGVKLERSLSDIKHTLYFPSAEGDDLAENINAFIDRHNADMLIMLPNSHRSMKELFHRSNTKKMAFHTHIPLLALND